MQILLIYAVTAGDVAITAFSIQPFLVNTTPLEYWFQKNLLSRTTQVNPQEQTKHVNLFA